MKKKIKAWLPYIIIAVLSWYINHYFSLPEFLMRYIRQTGPLAILIPLFLYAWLLAGIYLFKTKSLSKITKATFISTLIGIGVFYGVSLLGALLDNVSLIINGN